MLEKKADKKGKKKREVSKKDKKAKKRHAKAVEDAKKAKKSKKKESPSLEESAVAREKKAAARKKKRSGDHKKRSSPSASPRKDKKRRKRKGSGSRGSSSARSKDSDSDGEEPLFEPKKQAKKGDQLYPKKGDRGPFGSGMPVAFKSEDTSESDEEGSVFREAPAQPARSCQLALMAYSHRHPGRLAARLLIKMKDEVLIGSAGAKTPPSGVQYLLQILTPKLGSKSNIRTLRELRTLMVVLDLLARSSPGRAADVVAQRVKALERATCDGAWTSAQFLELIPSESSSLLDRDEQVYLNKEALLEQKLRHGEKPAWRAEKPGKKGEKGKGRGQKGSEDQAGKGKKDRDK